jgi:hypothetical protein
MVGTSRRSSPSGRRNTAQQGSLRGSSKGSCPRLALRSLRTTPTRALYNHHSSARSTDPAKCHDMETCSGSCRHSRFKRHPQNPRVRQRILR